MASADDGRLIFPSCIIYLVIKAASNFNASQLLSFVVLKYINLHWLVENRIIATTLFTLLYSEWNWPYANQSADPSVRRTWRSVRYTRRTGRWLMQDTACWCHPSTYWRTSAACSSSWCHWSYPRKTWKAKRQPAAYHLRQSDNIILTICLAFEPDSFIPISENLHLCLLAPCCYDNNADIDIDVIVAIKALNVDHQRWRQITTKCHIKVISLTCPSLEVFRHARRHLLVKLLLVLKACESSVRGVALLCPVYT